MASVTSPDHLDYETDSGSESVTYTAPLVTNPEDIYPQHLMREYSTHSRTDQSKTACSKPDNIRDISLLINNRQRRTAATRACAKARGTALHDIDNSGTYDPVVEQADARACARKKRARTRKIEKEVTNDDKSSTNSRHHVDAGREDEEVEEEETKPSSAVRPRKFVSCDECRQAKRRCPLKRHEEGPCRRCRQNSQACTLIYLPEVPADFTSKVQNTAKSWSKTSKGKKKGVTKKEHDDEDMLHHRQILNEVYKLSRRPISKPIKLKRHTGRRSRKSQSKSKKRLNSPERFGSHCKRSGISDGRPRGEVLGHRTQHIYTAFCHPIALNWISPSECSFHPSTSPFFPLFGLGFVLVEVIPWPAINRAGYEELSDGHEESGGSESRMCIACTTSRLKIILCPRHEMRPLMQYDDSDPTVDETIRHRGQNRDVFSCKRLEQSFLTILDSDSGHAEGQGKLAWETHWCSICPAPAEFICSSLDSAEGCGLLTCAACNDLLTKVRAHRLSMSLPQAQAQNQAHSSGGHVRRREQQEEKTTKSQRSVLDEVVTVAAGKNMRTTYPWGLRADVDFLLTDGELMVRLGYGQDVH